MLGKTKVMFKEDVKELYILYNKFKRCKSSVIAYLEKFIVFEDVESIGYMNGIFRFTVFDYPDVDLQDTVLKVSEMLRSQGFDASYTGEDEFLYLSLENLAEVILDDDY